MYNQYREDDNTRVSAQLHYGDMFKNDRYVQLRMSFYYLLVKDFINTNKKLRVLDVGGYVADNLQFWRNAGVDVSKIEYHVADYDKKAAEIVKERGGIPQFYDLNIDDLTKLYKENSFDLIICTEVLEHLLDPEKQIGFFKKLIKKDGRILISLPNENTIFHRIYSILGMGIDQYPFALYKHLHFPTVNQSKEFISRFLEIERIHYYYNFGGAGSRFGFVGKFMSLVPDKIWEIFVNNMPGLFARGTIFFCKIKS